MYNFEKPVVMKVSLKCFFFLNCKVFRFYFPEHRLGWSYTGLEGSRVFWGRNDVPFHSLFSWF